jgi:hypothetical protein
MDVLLFYRISVRTIDKNCKQEMNRNYLIAVILCKEQLTPSRYTMMGLKYHDVANKEGKIQQFMKFAATKKGAQYVNFYFKTTSRAEKGHNFAFRRYINR